MASKKQRRGRAKVSRRPRPDKLRGFSDSDVARLWVRTDTLRQNFERLGVVPDVNAPAAPLPLGPLASRAAVAAVLDAEDGGAAAAALARNQHKAASARLRVEPAELEELRALVARFGDNYKAMERDTGGLNRWQHSAAKLATRIKRMRDFEKALAADAAAAAAEAAAAEAAAAKATKASSSSSSSSSSSGRAKR